MRLLPALPKTGEFALALLPADAGGKRKFAHSIIVDRCTGCGACADACPKQAVLAVA